MPWTDAQFTALYNRTHTDVGLYCLRRLPPDDARDALTETYLVAWKKIDDLRDEDEAILWLYTIARNVVRNRARSARRSLRLVARMARERSAHEVDPAHQVVRSEEDRFVNTAVASLPPKDREIVRLRAYEELDYPQIALVLGCSIDAARQRLSRALKKLAVLLDDEPAGTTTRAEPEGGRHAV